jgi:hypothetical protein
MQIYLSDDLIHVTAGLLRRLDHDTLEAIQFGETNGHGAANFFDRLEEALILYAEKSVSATRTKSQ